MDRTSIAIVAMLFISIITILLLFFAWMSHFEDKIADAIDAIEERQVEEGTQYTAIIEAYDISNQLLVMGNGHEIDASELSNQPAVGDELSYIKTFDYTTDTWDGMPEETDGTAYVNIKIMNK